MGNQKKLYDNPKDAAKDLLTIGGAAIINKKDEKASSTPKGSR